MSVVQRYLQDKLSPRLKGLRLNKSERALILADVEQRLNSLLRHWADPAFRRVLLALGSEVAQFWRPTSASLDVRVLVLSGVRNSLIEDLNYLPAGRPEHAQRLTDDQVPVWTSEAIECFAHAETLEGGPVVGKDLFGRLQGQYPLAWAALDALGSLGTVQVSRDFTCVSRTQPLKQGSRPLGPAPGSVTASGMDPAFDAALRQALNAVSSRQMDAFHSPSFVRVTRNPEKLLAIIEQVLGHGASFVTTNYLLTAGHVAKRDHLLPSPHSADEFDAQKAGMLTGVTPRHRELLQRHV